MMNIMEYGEHCLLLNLLCLFTCFCISISHRFTMEFLSCTNQEPHHILAYNCVVILLLFYQLCFMCLEIWTFICSVFVMKWKRKKNADCYLSNTFEFEGEIADSSLFLSKQIYKSPTFHSSPLLPPPLPPAMPCRVKVYFGRIRQLVL